MSSSSIVSTTLLRVYSRTSVGVFLFFIATPQLRITCLPRDQGNSTMDKEAICDFSLQFWIGDDARWWPAMNGFDRDMKEMEESAKPGCHCCSIFLPNTDLLIPYAENLGLVDKNRGCL